MDRGCRPHVRMPMFDEKSRRVASLIAFGVCLYAAVMHLDVEMCIRDRSRPICRAYVCNLGTGAFLHVRARARVPPHEWMIRPRLQHFITTLTQTSPGGKDAQSFGGHNGAQHQDEASPYLPKSCLPKQRRGGVGSRTRRPDVYKRQSPSWTRSWPRTAPTKVCRLYL